MDIKLYGDIANISGDYSEYGIITLDSVNSMLEKANGEDLTLRINSPGGEVNTALSIYSAIRRYADDNNAKITTRTDGMCASSATILFLSGNKRIVNEYVEPFVHNAWTIGIGDSGEFTRIAQELEEVNNRIAEFYSKHTQLSIEEAKELMSSETSLSAEDCLNIGFATEIEEIEVPILMKYKNNHNNINMSEIKLKKEEKSLFNSIKSLLSGFNEDKIEMKVLHTATNQKLEFENLKEDDLVEVGATAKVDEKVADGEFVMQSGDTYVFENGKLTEIREKNQEVEDLKIEVQNKQTEIDTLKAQISEQEVEISKVNEIVAKFKELESKIVIDDKEDVIVQNSTKTNEKINHSELIKNIKL